ncbi:MAG: hypothetical protein UDM12_00120 [Prevotellamassilia sp.]|nr:hypothetical protein [Prevotellamassilia sp.]
MWPASLMFSKEQPMVLPVKEGKAICKVNDCLWESQTKRRFSCVCGFGCTSDAASESFHRLPKPVFAVGCMQKNARFAWSSSAVALLLFGESLPLTPKMFKIQKKLCAVLSQTTSGEACAHDNRTKREKERPERAVSPHPRATPWVSTYKRLRPVRAKVWANG